MKSPEGASGTGPPGWRPERQTMPDNRLSSQAGGPECRNRRRFPSDPRAVGRWRTVIESWKSPRRTRRDGWLERTRNALRSRGATWPAWALACVLGAAGVSGDRCALADSTPDVNQAKANMLWNIAKFVEWPALPDDRSQPLVFTILGEDDLAADLAGLLSSRTV